MCGQILRLDENALDAETFSLEVILQWRNDKIAHFFSQRGEQNEAQRRTQLADSVFVFFFVCLLKPYSRQLQLYVHFLFSKDFISTQFGKFGVASKFWSWNEEKKNNFHSAKIFCGIWTNRIMVLIGKERSLNSLQVKSRRSYPSWWRPQLGPAKSSILSLIPSARPAQR